MPNDQHTTDSKHILAVDDDPRIAQFMHDSLSLAHYCVTTASSGTEAIARVREATPDLLILDITMPDMDGFTCLQEMWSMGYAHPTILMTGTPQAQLQTQLTRLREWGTVDWVFIKPVYRSILLEKIEELLRKEEAAQQALNSRGEGWHVEKIVPIPEVKEVDLAGWQGWVVLLQSEIGAFGNSLVTYFPRRADVWKVLTMDHLPDLT